jgi:hypothetical protein
MEYQRMSGQGDRPWTLLVYMVSDEPSNPDQPVDLERIVDLDQILVEERRAILAAAGDRSADMHVAIQVDFLKPHGIFRTSSGGGEKRSRESVSTDPQVLDEFFAWGINEFPADRYAVLFCGHSSGPSGLFSDALPAFGFSRSLGQTLDLRALGECFDRANERIHALNSRRGGSSPSAKLEIVMFKDCFQSILETAFELGRTGYEERAAFMIASQGLIPVAVQGEDDSPPRVIPPWPYQQLFGYLARDEDTRVIAQKLVGALGDFYATPDHKASHLEVPMTLLNLEKVRHAVDPLKALADRLTRALDHPRESDAAYDALRRAFRGFVDGDPMLVDMQSLCDRLGELGIVELKVLGDKVDEALDLIVETHLPNGSKFGGLSAYYYPASSAERQRSAIGEVFGASYKRLRLNGQTGWHKVALAETPSMIARRQFS